MVQAFTVGRGAQAQSLGTKIPHEAQCSQTREDKGLGGGEEGEGCGARWGIKRHQLLSIK